jgi:hypothetical protein
MKQQALIERHEQQLLAAGHSLEIQLPNGTIFLIAFERAPATRVRARPAPPRVAARRSPKNKRARRATRPADPHRRGGPARIEAAVRSISPPPTFPKGVQRRAWPPAYKKKVVGLLDRYSATELGKALHVLTGTGQHALVAAWARENGVPSTKEARAATPTA